MTLPASRWPTLPPGCERIKRGVLDILTARFGDHAFEFTTFGGQLLRWSFKGREIFFANREHARTDGTVSYRGGNPICFPHFNKGIIFPDKRERSPAHGPVRTARWEVGELLADTRRFRIVTSVDTLSTDSLPGVPLTLSIAYEFTTEALSMSFDVHNRGERSVAFHLAVHTYFDALNVETCRVVGLGSEYLDGQQGLRPTQDNAGQLEVRPPLDRVYLHPESEITLHTSQCSLKIRQEHLDNSVVWNPGAQHTLTDVGSPAFLCVESAALLPAPSVAAGKSWRAALSYHPIG